MEIADTIAKVRTAIRERRQAGLRLPSDRRHEARTRTRAGGVTVPAALIDRIEALCATPVGFST